MGSIRAFKNLGELWIECLDEIMSSGTVIYDDESELLEICNWYGELDNAYMDEIIEAFADKARIKLMQEKYCTCGLVGDYKIDYGSYIFNNNGVNQIQWVTDRLKRKPETKSATISLHRPGEDMLTCLSMLDFKLRNGKLHMGVVYRSQNAYSSQPGNILALRHIQEDVAKGIGVPVGKISLMVFSLHVYKKDFEAANNILQQIKNRRGK